MDSFCAAPWRVHNINANGTASMCCINLSVVAADRRSLLEDPAMALAMAAMSSGDPVDGCGKCYDAEAAGGTSLRMIYNDLLGMPGPGGIGWFDLSLGNKCNQKCRICGPHNSTAWIPDAEEMSDIAWSHLRTRMPLGPIVDGNSHVDAVIADMLAAGDGFTVELKGGEPLYMGASLTLLRRMVDEGLHHRTGELRIITNGTASDDGILELLGCFPRIDLAISVDAVGPLHAYTRGSRLSWDECLCRWDALASLPNVGNLRIANTIYAYTAFGLGRLSEWKDSMFGSDVSMANAVLRNPRYLGLSVLTDGMRQLASSGLPDDHPATQPLRSPSVEGDGILRDRFAGFTRRLDAIRGENLVDMVPQLAPLMEARHG